MRAQLLRLLKPLTSVAAPHEVMGRAAEVASLLAKEELFRARLRRDELEMGTGRRGRLTYAGRRLARLRLEEHLCRDGPNESLGRGIAVLGSARLAWHFSSDDRMATFIVNVAPCSGTRAPCQLLRVDATRRTDDASRHTTKVRVRRAALAWLERLSRTGLDLNDLCHALVGYIPGTLCSDDWEIHEVKAAHMIPLAQDTRRVLTGCLTPIAAEII